MEKRILKRIWSGLKAGFKLPILPEHINKFNLNIYVRIFKFIGNITLFLILGGFINNVNYYGFYSIIFLSLIYILYRLILVFYIIKQLIYNIRNGKLIVKNSPTDYISTISKYCGNVIKSIAGVSISSGFTYSMRF